MAVVTLMTRPSDKEDVCDDCANHEQGNADNHQPALELLFAKLLGLLGSALGIFGGGLR